MRSLLLLFLMNTPLHAWQFAIDPICTLSHDEPGTEVVVTYDPSSGLYAIAITTEQGWPTPTHFSIRFDGDFPLTISTTRQIVVDQTLSVTDTGFGNVLNGIAANQTATAFTDTAAVEFDLSGSAEPVAEFNACVASPTV